MKFRLKAEHFDWLGVICFPFIFIYAYCALKTGEIPPVWMTQGLILIGVGGFFIDGTIIYKYFLKKKR